MHSRYGILSKPFNSFFSAYLIKIHEKDAFQHGSVVGIHYAVFIFFVQQILYVFRHFSTVCLSHIHNGCKRYGCNYVEPALRIFQIGKIRIVQSVSGKRFETVFTQIPASDHTLNSRAEDNVRFHIFKMTIHPFFSELRHGEIIYAFIAELPVELFLNRKLYHARKSSEKLGVNIFICIIQDLIHLFSSFMLTHSAS